jgi:hypothetical protein
LLFYSCILFFLFIILKLFARLKRLEDKITELVFEWHREVQKMPRGKTISFWKDKEVMALISDTVAKAERENLDALYWMYIQYCSGGHDFMGAGEDASEILENAGYITVDGAGRVLKDFGDSEEQKLSEHFNGEGEE